MTGRWTALPRWQKRLAITTVVLVMFTLAWLAMTRWLVNDEPAKRTYGPGDQVSVTISVRSYARL